MKFLFVDEVAVPLGPNTVFVGKGEGRGCWVYVNESRFPITTDFEDVFDAIEELGLLA